MEVDEVHAEADGWDKVENRVLVEEFPAKHPVDAVGIPFDIVQGIFLFVDVDDVPAFIVDWGFAREGIRAAFGHLRKHEVEAEPCKELLVLGTDVYMHPEEIVFELGVLEVSLVVDGIQDFVSFFVRSRDFLDVPAVIEGHGVDVVLEFAAHAVVGTAYGNKTADMVFFIEAGFHVGEGACGKC